MDSADADRRAGKRHLGKSLPAEIPGSDVSLRHILLGLAERECSGYDVKKEFDTSLRNFWG